MTKISDLPVLGHVPKKRKVDLTKTVTLAQVYELLDSDEIRRLLIEGEIDYALECLRDAFKYAARK